MTWNIKHTACAGALLAMVACDAEVDHRDGDGVPPLIPMVTQNSFRLNSFRLNSFRLNSFRLNSFRLNGDAGSEDYIEITGIDLPGKAKPGDSWLEDGVLYIETTKGKVLGGDDLEKTIISFTVQEDGVQIGRDVKIKRVKDAGKKHKKHDDELALTLYDLEVREGSKGKWEPLCVDEQGEAVDAVLLGDIWNPETGDRVTPRPSHAVTFACVDAALGKCATWGYRPWASVDGEPLADYHQACTRLARADYCGDGVSYTESGITIHVWDPLGVEPKSLDIPYVVEAEWGPDGAICLNAANTRLPNQDVACELPACGEDFASGGLIQSGTIVD